MEFSYHGPAYRLGCCLALLSCGWQKFWESGCLDEGMIRMADSAADMESSVEEPKSSTRMV